MGTLAGVLGRRGRPAGRVGWFRIPGVVGVRRNLLAVAMTVALAYLVLGPLFQIQKLALEDGAQGYRDAFSRPDIASTIWNTVKLAAGSLVIALVLGTGLAWAATQLPRRVRLLRVLPILPIVIPAVASVIGWALLLSPRPGYLNALLRKLPWWDHLDEGPVDIYSLPWIVILTGFGLTSFVYLFVSSGLANVNSELLEAAQVCGSRSSGVFFRITLPLLRPVLVYGGGVALLLGLGQFTGPLLLGRNQGVTVLTTQMYSFVSQSPVNYAAAAAIGSPLLLFGVLVVIGQRLLLGNQTRFVTHGGKAFRSAGKPSWVAALILVLYATVAIVLPLLGLAIVSLSPFWSPTIDTDAFTLDNFRKVLGESNITEALSTSLIASIGAVAIAIPIGYLVATILVRKRSSRVIRSLLDFVVALPLGVPAVVFGVGFLLAYTSEPFFLYGTRWVIVLVYVTLMLPFTVRMQLAGLLSLGDTYTEAARTSGAGPLRTSLEIVLPLMRGTIGGAAALMFVLLTHEFAASLLVRSPTTQVMGTVLFDYYSNGGYPTVAAIALVMTAVTSVGVVLAMAIGGADALDKL